jgi:hypothetical protein
MGNSGHATKNEEEVMRKLYQETRNTMVSLIAARYQTIGRHAR